MFNNLHIEWKLFGVAALITGIILAGAALAFIAFMNTSEPALVGSDPTPFPTESAKAGTDLAPLDMVNWQTYRNDEFGFEVKYPENMLLYPHLRVSPADFEGYAGLRFGELNNGCTLSIFRANSELDIDNPFEEVDTSSRLRQYVASEMVASADVVFYLGMSVASHAVDPEACHSTLGQILSTFRFIEGRYPYDTVPDGYDSRILHVKFPAQREKDITKTILALFSESIKDQIVDIRPLFSEQEAENNTILRRWFRIEFDESSDTLMIANLFLLQALAEIVEFAPLPIPPSTPISCKDDSECKDFTCPVSDDCSTLPHCTAKDLSILLGGSEVVGECTCRTVCY